MLERAQRLGVLIAAGPGRFEVPSPALLAVAERVVSRGVTLDGALAVFEQIERHCDAVSASFVKLFVDEVWEPFRAAGMPIDRWREIEESIAQLRPLATEALLAIFGQRMSAQIDSAFGALGQPLGSVGCRPVSAIEPEEQRAASREMWERAAEGWGSRADQRARVGDAGVGHDGRRARAAAGPDRARAGRRSRRHRVHGRRAGPARRQADQQ